MSADIFEFVPYDKFKEAFKATFGHYPQGQDMMKWGERHHSEWSELKGRGSKK